MISRVDTSARKEKTLWKADKLRGIKHSKLQARWSIQSKFEIYSIAVVSRSNGRSVPLSVLSYYMPYFRVRCAGSRGLNAGAPRTDFGESLCDRLAWGHHCVSADLRGDIRYVWYKCVDSFRPVDRLACRMLRDFSALSRIQISHC